MLRPLREIFDERDYPDLLIGLDVSDDATVYRISELVANELMTDDRGFLTGEARMHVDPLRKELALARMCRSLGATPEECVTVGDSELDRSFLHAGGLGVLVGDAERGEALGVPSVPDLSGLLALVDARR